MIAVNIVQVVERTWIHLQTDRWTDGLISHYAHTQVHIFNEVQKQMLYAMHLLPRGYFHTNNEMIVVNIVEVIEWVQTDSSKQTEGRTDVS